jgi:oxygen-dependent protoporphyrinogen oxidase
LIDSRLGREVRDRLVDPLIGGIHAGSTEHLSLAATAPQLETARGEHRSLMRALRESRPAPTTEPAPVFLTLPGGLWQLVEELARHLSGREVELRTSVSVDRLERDDRRWQLNTSHGQVVADAVLLAVPSFVAADLLAPQLADTASELKAIDHASVVLVTLAYPAAAVSIPVGVSGFLVPRVDGRLMTACTFMSAKWPQLARAGHVLIRVSAGRWGDERALELEDDELVARLGAELKDSLGIAGPPDSATVSRWPRSFPQYQVGHLERVARIRAGVARQPGLEVAGASYEGVGIPACIGQGRRAGRAMLEHLEAGSRRRAGEGNLR